VLSPHNKIEVEEKGRTTLRIIWRLLSAHKSFRQNCKCPTTKEKNEKLLKKVDQKLSRFIVFKLNTECRNDLPSISSTLNVRVFVRTSFFYLHVTRKKLPKRQSYEKRAPIMLMKLTPD